MSATDTSEKRLETLIMLHLTGTDGLTAPPDWMAAETPDALAAVKAAGSGWIAGNPKDYDRTHALDTPQLFAFLQATQPEEMKKLGIADYGSKSDIALLKFLARIESEIGKRGVIDVLRNGVKHGALSFQLFYGTPSPGNAKAVELNAANRFSITRQLGYSMDETRRALDLCIFINGLPIATFELKNSLTKQTVEDAIKQYRRDRDPREKLFAFGRCVAHFALDEQEVMFCTQLKGKASWFLNNSETITEAFADYYRTTVLSEETDPNKLHDLKATLDNYQVYSPEKVDALVTLYLEGAERDKLDPILDACVAIYKQQLDENGQIDFKGKAKAFVRTYDFLASILPYTNREWEKLSIFLNFLIPKLPAPEEPDLAKGILEAIDMDSYRAEKKTALKISLPDENAEIEPVPTTGGGRKAEPELDRLSNILKMFNEHFKGLFTDGDRVVNRIKDEIVPKVAADRSYQNAKQNTPNTARIEHDKALAKVMLSLLKDDTEIYKQFSDNESFKRFVRDMVFELTNE